MLKIDKYPFGIVIGTLAPFIGIFLIYLQAPENTEGFFDFLKTFLLEINKN